jgi:peptidoglycan/xylan/chitin deacetylase (PgdA/CDA1 family)
MAEMDSRRGRRPTPEGIWRRAVTSTAILAMAAVVTAVTLHSTAPVRHGVLGARTPQVTATPEDDAGSFVDPTPPQAQIAVATPRPNAPESGRITLPILLYHYVRVNPVATDQVGFELSVTPPNFALQMGFLRFAGVHTVNLGDAMQALRSNHPLPARSVVLTFDDGYRDFATVAAPVLQHDGLRGTVFVVSGFVGRHGYMDATQVRQVQDMGMTIGVHTVNHIDLSSVPLDIARNQIDVSHAQLDALAGRHLLDFAYPYGGFNAAVEQLVLADGFRDAVTTQAGAVLRIDQPAAWPRYHVGGSDTLYSFAHKALLGLPVETIDAMVRAYLASPAASSSSSALPGTPRPVAMGAPQGEATRRLT